MQGYDSGSGGNLAGVVLILALLCVGLAFFLGTIVGSGVLF